MSNVRQRLRVARNARTLVDREALEADLHAITEANRGNSSDRHNAIVARLKRALAEGREVARTWLNEDAAGLSCAQRLSRLMDACVSALYVHVTTDLYPRANPSSGERVTVVAVGGYGRGAMAPGSDVDLLFLLPYKQTAWAESVVEAMLYVLWDTGLKVGHSRRTIDECIRLSRADMTIRTAVLESRFIAGDEELFDEKVVRFDEEVTAGTAAEFAAAKLAERDERLGKSGGASRYLVEPNVKEGKGALRDLNTLFWIGKYVYRVREVEDLVDAGLFSAAELRLFMKCEDFLWAVRCHLHFITGRAEDRLSFDLQREIAVALGYTEHPGLSDVERFMKHYFLVAKDVGDLTAIVCHALEARQQKPKPKLDRFLTRFRKSNRRAAPENGAFIIDDDRLNVHDDQVFARDPVNLIRFFKIMDAHELPAHPAAARLITKSLKLIDGKLRESEEANQLFLEILTSRRAPEKILRRMNETGVLGKFIPDFGRIVAMMQFNMYHHFTVDEHLLRTVGNLSEIEAGRAAEQHPLANELMPTVRDRVALYVAVFLHDIAKGRPEDHSVAGARVARRVCPRLGLTPGQTETVAWLIEQHLTMSIVAQSRDLSDRRTIEDFAKIVQSPERLKMLLILTIADIKAVGPGVWNGWKGQLLRTLYWETELVLTGGHSAGDRRSLVNQAQAELRERLSDWSAADFESYAQRQYAPYWLKTEPARAERHARFLTAADKENRTLATDIATDAFRGVTEVTVLAPDHPKLLSVIAGACAAAGANIVDAHINTTIDGFALDTIFVGRAFPEDEDELRRAGRIADGVEKALRGELRLTEAVASRAKATAKGKLKAFQIEPEVTITNAWSDKHTVLEVVGLDRPGLLYDLTDAISRLNLNIASAHVATFGERAVDVFYVTDLTGAKISSAPRQGTIRSRLKGVFAGHDEKPKAAARH